MTDVEYEQAVQACYESLYGFAYSLAGNADEACELTQEAFCRLLTRGGQLRDVSKVKAWLFTTLYRVFLGWKNRAARLPHFEISSVEHELPALAPEQVDTLENEAVLQALLEIEERYRLPLMLHYLEDHSYQETAALLDIPVGTVMSRLSRGKLVLRRLLSAKVDGVERRVVRLDSPGKLKSS